MSLKSLEQRFNERVNDLYSGATLKFDGGRPSNGRNDDPLIVRRPGKGYWTFAEGRSLPVVSALNDVKRVTLFTLSQRGLLFLAKQQLLQTGNTFEFTRIINPLFVVGNAVPFLHIKRNLRPLSELAGKTDTSYNNIRKLGQLQKTTYDTVSGKWQRPKYFDNAVLGTPTAGSGFFGALGSRLKNFGSSVISPITNTISAFTVKRNVGEQFGNWNENSWKLSRPELKENNVVSSVQTLLKGYSDRQYADIISSRGQNVGAPLGSTPFIKYFNGSGGINSVNNADSEIAPVSSIAKRSSDPITPGKLPENGKISYIKDPSNIVTVPNTPEGRRLVEKKVRYPYTQIPTEFDDIITVSFAMGSDEPVKFRAFIKDLTQNVTPQYKDYQYIGRIEKFITYTGVQRDIQFKLGVIAFSKDELDMVWRRINFLTGLVYPFGFYNGIFQPNITKLTIGNVYNDQPGYITSLETNFNETSETWDIDAEVPIAASMNIRFTLIEKASRIASSPFYRITETMDRFSNTIDPGLESVVSSKLTFPKAGITSNGNTLTPTGQVTPRLPSAPRQPTLPVGRDELLNINLRG